MADLRICDNDKIPKQNGVTGLKDSSGSADIFTMSLMADMLVGKKIEAVMSDSEVTYLMLHDGTQVTIRGLVVVEPGRPVAAIKVDVPEPAADFQIRKV